MITIREAQCVRALQSGDETALEEIIRRYSGFVGAIVRNILGKAMAESDAEETVSDVFVTLWDNAEKISPGKLRPYLASIARSRAKNKLREIHTDLCLDDDLLLVSPNGPERQFDEAEAREAVRRAVRALPPRDRDLFIRHYYLCQTAREIAEETGGNLNTVQTRLRRGRERFKDLLIKEGYFSDDKDL